VNRILTRIVAGAALGTALAVVPALPAQAKMRPVQCKAGYQFYQQMPRRLKSTWSSRARNLGGSTDRFDLTVTHSGTVTTTGSASITADIEAGWGPFKASLQTQFGIEVAKSTTATRGENYSVLVPPRREVRVKYGVWTRRYRGLYLSATNPEPGHPPRLWPVIPPPNCGLYIVKEYSANVATRETGFQKSKPRRINR
jgi:hypothetical protein